MKYLDLSLSTPEENLACDEALLELSEEVGNGEVLRFWESHRYFVVLGYSRKFRLEVNLESCNKYGIPVLRRPSGGGTVLQGPGCLNYSLILNTQNSGLLKTINDTNRYVLNRHKQILEPILKHDVQVEGVSDLTLNNLKFSGNAQRRKKSFVLFHGTFLLDFKIKFIEKTLPIPSNQPAYRKNRTHDEFLVNLKIPKEMIKEAFANFWKAHEIMESVPAEKIDQLIKLRYANQDWNFKY